MGQLGNQTWRPMLGRARDGGPGHRSRRELGDADGCHPRVTSAPGSSSCCWGGGMRDKSCHAGNSKPVCKGDALNWAAGAFDPAWRLQGKRPQQRARGRGKGVHGPKQTCRPRQPRRRPLTWPPRTWPPAGKFGRHMTSGTSEICENLDISSDTQVENGSHCLG